MVLHFQFLHESMRPCHFLLAWAVTYRIRLKIDVIHNITLSRAQGFPGPCLNVHRSSLMQCKTGSIGGETFGKYWSAVSPGGAARGRPVFIKLSATGSRAVPTRPERRRLSYFSGAACIAAVFTSMKWLWWWRLRLGTLFFNAYFGCSGCSCMSRWWSRHLFAEML